MRWTVCEGFPTENTGTSNEETAQHIMSTLISGNNFIVDHRRLLFILYILLCFIEAYRDGVQMGYPILQAVCDCECMDQDLRDQLSSQILVQQMTTPSVDDNVTTVESVLGSQHNWQYSTLPEHLRLLYSNVGYSFNLCCL